MCRAPAGSHSWSSVTAVNQSSAYNKCSAMYTEADKLIAGVCASAYTVRSQSNDRGSCPYPNPTNSAVTCGFLRVQVENGSGQRHGLRGVGYY